MYPWFWQACESIEDPRENPLYSMSQVLALALFMFACRIPSRNQLDKLSDDDMFLRNWCLFSRATTETVICSRQMINVLAMIDPEELGALIPRFLKTMLRNKQASNLYLLEHVMLVADGTGVFSSQEPHCKQCLYQNHKDGSTTYLHNMLEIKAVGWDGLAVPVLSEPQLNDENKTEYDKQDCETKAYHRALAKIKQYFPREPFVHLLDSLYSQGPIFKAIDKCRHKFISNFKSGSIPTLYDEGMELIKLNPKNRIVKEFKKDGKWVKRIYTWATQLQYYGLQLAMVVCRETKNDEDTTFVFLTNFEVDHKNAQLIADGGRQRWIIENQGFNEQKNGYELEHFCDCNKLNVMLCLYHLLQIAHLFMQLLERSNLIESMGHLTILAKLLLESIRNMGIPDDIFSDNALRMQIRFAKLPP